MSITMADVIWQDVNTSDEATAIMRDMLDTHGLPNALAYVPIRVRDLIPAPVLRVMMAETRQRVVALPPVDDDARRLTMLEWCDENAYAVVTTRKLAEIGNCSQAMARHLIADNPHYFRRLDQYTHEVRNYKEERAREKATA